MNIEIAITTIGAITINKQNALTVLRFVNDVTTHGVDEQFMWGPGVMVSPVLTEVNSYQPV